jgi:GT2 family glycosyltransferase
MEHLPAPASVGVAIPVWNGAQTLAWTLLSLQAQAPVVPQVLAADSGSHDGTLEILQRAQVATVYEPPGNMYRAVNRALRGLPCEWLTWVNSDDWLYPGALARLIACAEAAGADIAFGQCDYVDFAGRFLYVSVAARLPQIPPLLRAGYMPFCQPAAIFRRRVFEHLNGLSEDYRNISDLDFFRRAAAAGFRFARLTGPSVAAFRVHPGQLTQREADVIRRERAAMLAADPPQQPARRGRLALWRWRAGKLRAQLVRRLHQVFVRTPAAGSSSTAAVAPSRTSVA